MRIWIWVCYALLASHATAQTIPSDPPLQAPISANTERDISHLGQQAGDMAMTVQRQSLQTLARLQRQEENIQQVLGRRDSSIARTSQSVLQQYDSWRQRLVSLNAKATTLKQYIPRLDSLETALRFLSAGPGANALPIGDLSKLQSLNTKLSSLSGQLQQADELGNFLRGRQAILQQQLSSLGLVNRLTAFKKQVYYYKAEIAQYKATLSDPDRLANRIISLASSRPEFQHFFNTHSYLSSLYRLPGSDSLPSGKALPGLQTRKASTDIIQSHLGKNVTIASALQGITNNQGSGGSPGDGGSLPSGMQQAGQELNTWKQKILGAGGESSATEMPDFQPNPQHTKTFLKRLQLGMDFQTQNSTIYIPAVSTIGLTLGYKLNPKSLVGIGAAYIVGWGQPFDHIKLSSQGASLRSFFNWKLKGSFWASGGLEMNYLNAFTTIDQLRSFNAWQSSVLFGILKQYKAGSRSGNIQLLFDALYKEHVPQSQPIVFRVGYSLN